MTASSKQQRPTNKSFQEALAETNVALLRAQALLILIAVPAFWALDWIAARDHVWFFLGLRLICGFYGLVQLVLFRYRREWLKRHAQPITFSSMLLVGGSISVMCWTLGDFTSGYYVGIGLVFMTVGFLFLWPERVVTSFNLTLYIFYLLPLLAGQMKVGNAAVFIEQNFFLVTVIIIATLARVQRMKMEREKFAYSKELREATSHLEEANVQLRELDTMKDRFFAGVSHELRTPLVALSSTMQLILDRGLRDEGTQRRLLRGGRDAIADMLDNVNDLLLKTRSQQGALGLEVEGFEVRGFLERLVAVFEPMAQERGIALSLVFDGVDSGLQIVADRSKLRKMLNNLVINALKFTSKGSVEVRCACVGEADARRLHLRVTDTGQGIPAEDLARIFEPFVQASNSRQRDAQGTGLGLSLVRDLAKLHGGDVSVTSTLGKGSSFLLDLPLQQVPADALASKAPAALEEGTAQSDPEALLATDVFEATSTAARAVHGESKLVASELRRQGSSEFEAGSAEHRSSRFQRFSAFDAGKSTVLIVEDNAYIAEVLGHVLAEHCNLRFASDGQAALESMRAQKPDLVLSDVMMPNMNGYELLRSMRKSPALKPIPVILLTSRADDDSRLEGFDAGADEYISKPFHNREVLTRVIGLLERRKLEAEFIHSEKLRSVGQMAAGIAHEINNPIFYAKSAAGTMEKVFASVKSGKISLDKGMEMMGQAIERVKEGTERVTEITVALRGFVRSASAGFSRSDIHAGIDATLRILSATYKDKVFIEKNYALKDQVVCNTTHLNQVWMNLLQNAIHALEEVEAGRCNQTAQYDLSRRQQATAGWTPRITIRTRRLGAFAIVEIEDNGPGVPKELQRRIFEPFFTTKEQGKGTGLGLHISQQVVEEHEGRLEVVDAAAEMKTPGSSGGALWRVTLPIEKTRTRGESDERTFTHSDIDKSVEAVQYPYRG